MQKQKLYVGSLAYKTTEDKLFEAFSKFGPVAEVKIITDRATGQSKGYGFITMQNPEDAEEAVKGMNGTELDGRTLIVNIARDPQPRSNDAPWQKNRPPRR